MKAVYRLIYGGTFEDVEGFESMSTRLHYLLSQGYSDVTVRIVRA